MHLPAFFEVSGKIFPNGQVVEKERRKKRKGFAGSRQRMNRGIEEGTL